MAPGGGTGPVPAFPTLTPAASPPLLSPPIPPPPQFFGSWHPVTAGRCSPSRPGGAGGHPWGGENQLFTGVGGVSYHYGNLGGGLFPAAGPPPAPAGSRRGPLACFDDSSLFLPASPSGSCCSQQAQDPPLTPPPQNPPPSDGAGSGAVGRNWGGVGGAAGVGISPAREQLIPRQREKGNSH